MGGRRALQSIATDATAIGSAVRKSKSAAAVIAPTAPIDTEPSSSSSASTWATATSPTAATMPVRSVDVPNKIPTTPPRSRRRR